MAMVICAGLLVVAAVLSALTIDNDVLRAEPEHPVAQPECLTCLPINASPLEPGNPAEGSSGPGNRVEAPPQAH